MPTDIIKDRLREKTRDHLIGCLATFDLFLSLSMPLSALDVLTESWPLGPNTIVIAQVARSLPTAIAYSSSMIIILIAINCYRQILHSSERQLTPHALQCLLGVIITFSITITSPIFYFTKLDPLFEPGYEEMLLKALRPKNVNKTGVLKCKEHNDVNLSLITFVVDDWPVAKNVTHTNNIRLYYSIFSLFSQLIIPFCVISVCYYAVYNKLKRQAKIQRRVIQTQDRMRRENARNKVRNKLLAIISLVYFITWLPLSIFGSLSDANIEIFGANQEIKTIIFMICHLIGMSSACANPLIYGYRNKHVRKGKHVIKLFDIYVVT